jgi:DNA (cytosine-5)-methyltransferase 1
VYNFGADSHSNDDIAIIVKKLQKGDFKLPKVDLVVGGFPCQDYSVAKALNSAHGIKGKKGVLWWEIYNLLELNRPKYVLLENVDRLLKSPSKQPGRDFAVMLRSLANLGYLVEWRVINAADYGFPQRRKRVFILAHKKSTGISGSFEKFFSTGSILSKAFPNEMVSGPFRFSIQEKLWLVSRDFGRKFTSSSFCNSGYFNGKHVYTWDVNPVYTGPYSTLGDILDTDVNSEFWINEIDLPKWKFLKGAKSIPRTSKSGHTYQYSEGSMTFPDSLDRPSRTILTAEGGSTPSRFKHIISLNGKYRRLTPNELERLNGFPVDWTKCGRNGEEFSPAKRAFFMGNALVVGIVEAIAQEIAIRLKDSD